MSLRDQLLAQEGKEKFISVSALEELITSETVEKHLRTFSNLAERPVDSTLVSKIVSSARQLFSILVLLKLESLVPDLIANGTTDSIFPIRDKNDLPDRILPKDRESILSQQTVFPLVFKHGDTMEIPENYKLPFLEEKTKANGAFGVVSKAKIAEGHLVNMEAGSFVAVKKIEKFESWDPSMREVQTLRNRQHPNIVPLLASFTQSTRESGYPIKSLSLIFPWADMNLKQWMSLESPPQFLWSSDPERTEQRKYLYDASLDLLTTLSFIHRPDHDNKASSHHDLKPENILVFGEVLKICDFGHSHLRSLENGSETEREILGTFTYHPPEYYNKDGTRAPNRHGRAFDMWTMGCIMIELAILIVYGWELERIKCFREERSQHGSRKLNGRNDAFHNNMDEVKRWIEKMKEDDGSAKLINYLDIAEEMLNTKPDQRLCSWEACLDLNDLYYPDRPKGAKNTAIEDIVPRPWKKSYDTKQTPVHRASSKGNIARLRILLEKGWPADEKDSEGNTPSHLANERGHTKVYKYLRDYIKREAAADAKVVDLPINRGAGPEEEVLRKDENGRTRFHKAAYHSEQGAVESILKSKLAQQEIRVKDKNGLMPIHVASRKASTEIVSLILKASGDPESLVMAKDGSGKTPLHWAALEGSAKTVEALLSAGRDKFRMCLDQDDEGKTPLDLARTRDNEEVERLLREITSKRTSRNS